MSEGTDRGYYCGDLNTERDGPIVLGRDEAAFAALYRQYLTPVYKYFYLHVGNHHNAEDLTATTFSKAVAGLGRYAEQGKFAAWLFSIARHTLQDHWRRRREQVDLDVIAETLISDDLTPEDGVVRAELVRDLQQLIAQLPTDQKKALVLRFVARLSTAEVAAALGRSEGSVKMLVHRAITRLRSLCSAEGQV